MILGYVPSTADLLRTLALTSWGRTEQMESVHVDWVIHCVDFPVDYLQTHTEVIRKVFYIDRIQMTVPIYLLYIFS